MPHASKNVQPVGAQLMKFRISNSKQLANMDILFEILKERRRKKCMKRQLLSNQ